jgi:hypothetical protein
MPQIDVNREIGTTTDSPSPPRTKETTMNTNLKKLAGAAAIAAGTAAALFGAAGTADAALLTSYTNNGLGTVVQVTDTANPDGAVETCTYSSHAQGNPFLLPYFSAVTLTGKTPSNLQIFGIQTGTKYTVDIFCPNSGTNKHFSQTF